MKLFELFDTKVNYEVVTDTNNSFETQARIGSKIINFVAYLDYGSIWDVGFHYMNLNGKNISYSMTNDNHQLEVLSFVKQSLLELIARYQPEEIVFTADKESSEDSKNSRARVYKKMLKDLESHGYSLHVIPLGKNSEHFSLTKI